MKHVNGRLTGALLAGMLLGNTLLGGVAQADGGGSSGALAPTPTSAPAPAAPRPRPADPQTPAPIMPLGGAFTADATVPYSGLVGLFTDTNPGDGPGQFSATINWGDGSPLGQGSIVSNSPTSFGVTGQHVYSTPGTYTIDTTLETGGQAFQLTDTANVQAAPATVQINDTDPTIQYHGAGWGYYGPGRGVGDIGDDVHATTNDGDFVDYTFTGTGITYITERSVDEGPVNVAIDGVYQQTVNAQSGDHNLANQALYTVSGLPYGQHTITLIKAGGTYLLVDAFVLQTQGTTINDTDPQLKYAGSGWFYNGGRPASFVDVNNDVHATTNNGDSVSYTFTGTGVAYVTEKSSGYGTVDVYLDGVFQQTVDANGPFHNQGGQVLFSKTGLSAGQHTIKLVKTGGAYMLLDALTVQR
ncbi:MAG: hypothetical protein JOY78_15075 [Pseudonocardia sp.]|nr:hypothetical protein [Pseudonocardia sp.]